MLSIYVGEALIRVIITIIICANKMFIVVGMGSITVGVVPGATEVRNHLKAVLLRTAVWFVGTPVTK